MKSFFGEPLSSKISLEHGKTFHNIAPFIYLLYGFLFKRNFQLREVTPCHVHLVTVCVNV